MWQIRFGKPERSASLNEADVVNGDQVDCRMVRAERRRLSRCERRRLAFSMSLRRLVRSKLTAEMRLSGSSAASSHLLRSSERPQGSRRHALVGRQNEPEKGAARRAEISKFRRKCRGAGWKEMRWVADRNSVS